MGSPAEFCDDFRDHFFRSTTSRRIFDTASLLQLAHPSTHISLIFSGTPSNLLHSASLQPQISNAFATSLSVSNHPLRYPKTKTKFEAQLGIYKQGVVTLKCSRKKAPLTFSKLAKCFQRSEKSACKFEILWKVGLEKDIMGEQCFHSIMGFHKK